MPNPIYSTDHVLVVAATIPVPATAADSALHNGFLLVDQAGLRIDVLDIYCDQCTRSYDDIRSEPCQIPQIGNAHLRGGPIGTRRARKCKLHNELWDRCAHLHEEPTNYGRPPMPPMATAV